MDSEEYQHQLIFDTEEYGGFLEKKKTRRPLHVRTISYTVLNTSSKEKKVIDPTSNSDSELCKSDYENRKIAGNTFDFLPFTVKPLKKQDRFFVTTSKRCID
jgi:hypothetical protein